MAEQVRLVINKELNKEEENMSKKFDPLNILAGRLIEVKHSMNDNFDDDILADYQKNE
jgi:hypothetical protein